MPDPQPDYNRDQINYIHQLRDQAVAVGDVPKEMGISSFMIGHYFRNGYDEIYNQYWKGQRHKVNWQGLGKRADISDRVNDVHRFP